MFCMSTARSVQPIHVCTQIFSPFDPLGASKLAGISVLIIGVVIMKRSIFVTSRVFAAAMIYALVVPMMVLGADTRTGGKPLSEDQKILHVLNRLGFGARSGDVERVKSVGLQKYIDQQLNPAAIDDAVAESKVKGLDVFGMST